jgi:hypothetical protein
VSSIAGNYRKDSISVLKSIISIVAGFFVVSSLTYFFKEYAYSRGVIIINYFLLVFIFSSWRILVKLFFKLGVLNVNSSRIRTLIVGDCISAVEIAKKLKTKHTSLHTIEGLIGQTRKEIGQKVESYSVIGSLDNIIKIIQQRKINEVIFASGEVTYNQIMKVVSDCQKENVEFKLAGSNLDFLVGKSTVTLLDDIPLINITYNISQISHRFIKRTMDIVLSFFVLIFIYPLTFLIPSSIKKRSMIIKMISQVYKVLIGKLSFVGPKETINDFNLFLGKQGLTGLWFIENDDDSVRLDIFYAKNQNIWLDLEILGKTISKILFNRY